VDRALATGFYDATRPMDDIRRALIEDKLKERLDPEELPDHVPTIFLEASCNRLGCICPVFFAAEELNETQKRRRRGRYIPFKTKMRVVRRDNHTCQHCGIHLRDDEIEFDHIIPISKGGSSDEHNIRLTCYDCNRDKSDKFAL
jgi:HNH endonuclease